MHMLIQELRSCYPFVQSKKIESVIAMSKMYNCLPSDLLKIEDDYTSFCFNEACAIIMMKIDKGEKPIYKTEQEEQHYSNFKDLYKQYN